MKSNQWIKTIFLQIGFVAAFLFAGIVFMPVNAQNTAAQGKDTSIHQATNVEQLPEFPGGDNALRKFLIDNLTYPNLARSLGIDGLVEVSFVVNKDGAISDVTVARSPHQSLSDEAIRVVKLMPNWKPGMQDGKVVNVKFVLPIEFYLSGGREKKTKK